MESLTDRRYKSSVWYHRRVVTINLGMQCGRQGACRRFIENGLRLACGLEGDGSNRQEAGGRDSDQRDAPGLKRRGFWNSAARCFISSPRMQARRLTPGPASVFSFG